MQYSTKPCICLRPTGNIQGSYLLINMHTSHRIKHHMFNPLHAPPHIIACIHYEADEGKKLDIEFYNRHVNPIKNYSLNYPTDVDNNANNAGLDEIDATGVVVDQIGDENYNNEIKAVDYGNNGKITGVD